MDVIDHLFIRGERVEPSTSSTITVVSPWSEQSVATVPNGTTRDMDRAVAAAVEAQRSATWGHAPLEVRVAAVRRFADVYAARKQEIADAMVLEMGCPVTQVLQMHVEPASVAFRYYAELAASYPFVERREGARTTLVRRRPVGVSAAIVPWNGPAFLSVLKVAPALAAGCAVVLKPSPEAPLSAYVLADIAAEAELPAGALNVVPADRDVSEYLVAHPDVNKVSFTGSTAVGRRVAELCGRSLKRVGLELGGKSAGIILPDADIDSTGAALRTASFANAGQVCTARTRVLIPRARYAEVCDALAYAHERGFVHCDFKPANVFLTDTAEVKVIDFGLAKRFRNHDGAHIPYKQDAHHGVGTSLFASINTHRGIGRFCLSPCF